MTAHIENGIEIFRFQIGKFEGLGMSRLCLSILLETRHRVSLILLQIALWIDWRLPAPRRGEGYLRTAVSEDKMESCEFLEPESGLAACITQLVVEGQRHRNFHIPAPLSSFLRIPVESGARNHHIKIRTGTQLAVDMVDTLV